jgi:dihydrofolate reductase
MSIVRAHMSTSLDGFTSGLNQRFEVPFGDNTEHLNDWMFKLPTVRRMFAERSDDGPRDEGYADRMASIRDKLGESGGETDPSDDVFAERIANIGAFIMGRNMFGGGPGPWKQEPQWNGWWGENPPYHVPVYVLTHHPRPSVEMKGGTTFHFITDGVASALAKAKASAGKKDVVIAGGAHAVQQYLSIGAIDELELHLVPVLVGGGDRIFDNVPASKIQLEQIRVVPGNGVTHLRYRVVR